MGSNYDNKTFSQIDIFNGSTGGDLNNFSPNGEWEMIGVPVRRHEVYYSCCLEPYPDVTFWVVIRRKPLYYVFNLILPCILITAITILVFYLPSESGEKASFVFPFQDDVMILVL